MGKENRQTPLVSVIIPVYNMAQYLPECLDSVCEQTYPHLEIITVNDGSTDTSGVLLQEYAQKDSRIRVVTQENQGASVARNMGLEYATGLYVIFLDGDDWLELDTVALCVMEAQAHNADCVLFSYVREYASRSIPNPLFEHGFFYPTEEAERCIHRRLVGLAADELQHPERIDNLSSVCMKLYRNDVARKGRIVSEREVGTSEDTIFNLYALDGCSISYINQCLYHYRKTNFNSITTHYKANLIEKWDILYRYFEEYIISSGREAQYRQPFLNRVACGMIGLGLNEVNAQTSLFQRSKRIQQILQRSLYRQAFSQMDCSACPVHWRFFFLLCKHNCSFSLTLLLIVINHLRSRTLP